MADTIYAPFDPAANAYCSVAEADAYHLTHVAGETWANYDEDVKIRALIQATRNLDAYVTWYGWATQINSQVLAFPRQGLYDPATTGTINSETIPQRLKNACAEQARLLLERDRSLESGQGQDGLSRIKAGSVELEFTGAGAGAGVLQAIAPSAWQFIQSWGTLNQAGVGGAVALSRA